MKKDLKEDFELRDTSENSHENNTKIIYMIMVFGLTSLMAFGVYSFIEFIISLIR